MRRDPNGLDLQLVLESLLLPAMFRIAELAASAR
jgi:hypothetical protein